MISEYLKRCRKLSENKKLIHSNVSYIKLLVHAERLEARALRFEERALWYDQKLRDYEKMLLEKNEELENLSYELMEAMERIDEN